MDIRAERMTRMATIEIKMLGGFEIRVNGKQIGRASCRERV